MATLLGTDTYKKQTSTNAGARPDGQTVSGTVVEIFATYTTLATEASGDVLPLFVLPIGAILRSLLLSTDGVGGTSVIMTSIGDAGSATRYATADLALTAAGVELPMVPVAAQALTPFAVDTAANQTITGTLTGTFPMTVGKVIVVRATYRMP